MAEPISRAFSLLANQIPTDGYPKAPDPVQASPAAQALADARLGGLQAVSSPQAAQGMQDVLGRGVASMLGTPVDMAALALGAAGYQHPAPVMGSEWIGQQMEQAGMISPERRPAAELLASIPSPAGLGKAGMGFAAAISPEGKARLLADLTAGKGSGTYRLGDVSEGQSKGLGELFGQPSGGRNVYMTDHATDHILQRRVQQQGFSPADVTSFAEQALAGRAKPDLNTSKGNQYPAMLNTGARDSVTGRAYDARMPLRQVEDGYEARSVIAEGLRGRNNKAPKR